MKKQCDVIYQFMQKKILSGEWKPGMMISERGIAMELGMSRTPTREAFQRLLQEGILERGENGFVQIHRLTPREVLDVYQIRFAIEPMAAQLAAENGSPECLEILRDCCQKHEVLLKKMSEGALGAEEYSQFFYVIMLHIEQPFHQAIYKAAGNQLMEKIFSQTYLLLKSWNMVQSDLPRFLVSPEYLPDFLASHQATLEEHRRILEAIENRDAQAALDMAAAHLRHGLKNAQINFKSQVVKPTTTYHDLMAMLEEKNQTDY